MVPDGGPTERTDPFRLAGTTIDKKYQIHQMIGEGGFGVVYVGRHLRLDVPIAVKALKVPQDFNEDARRDFIARFQLEARTIARLKHPSIVTVLDTGVTEAPTGDVLPWMVLEWLKGRSLAEELERNAGPRRPSVVLAILRPVFDAVNHAHEEGIAHRDLKPANIMLVPERKGVSPKVLDFGIAKVMEQEETAGSGATTSRSTQKAFSLAYAAPEQVVGARTGPWTDTHALALIVIEVLSGNRPYRSADTAEIYSEVLSAQRPTPARVGIEAGPWEAILERALAKKPADRFASAGALLEALSASAQDADLAFTKSPLLKVAPELPLGDAPTMPAESVVARAPSPAISAAPKGRLWLGVGFSLLGLGALFGAVALARRALVGPGAPLAPLTPNVRSVEISPPVQPAPVTRMAEASVPAVLPAPEPALEAGAPAVVRPLRSRTGNFHPE